MKRRDKLSWKQLSVCCCLLLAFTGLTTFLFGYKRDEKLFTQISSQLFVEELTTSTLNMHYTLANPADFGIYDYEVRLPGYSAESSAASRASSENLLSVLKELNPRGLTPEDRYARTLLLRSLENSLNKNRFTYYDEPLSPSSGMQSQLPILLAEYTFRTKRDVEDYLALLDQTDEYFHSLLVYEQEKADAGLLMASSSLERVKEQCDTIITAEELDAGTHFLQTTFAERIQLLLDQDIVSAEDMAKYVEQNNRLLKTVLLPAYESLADGLFVLEDDSVPLAGLSSKPDGALYYRYLLTSETGSYRDISEIKELLLAQLGSEYRAICTLTENYPELTDRSLLESSVTFPYLDAEIMLADLQQRMTSDFPAFPAETDTSQNVTLPNTLPSVTVKTVSDSLESYCAPAFYLTTPLDDTDSNVIYINEKNAISGLELYTTLAHEGYPGHLYQNVYSSRAFLTNGENKIRRLLWYGGYLEGWALYVEFFSYDYAAEIYREHGFPSGEVLTQLEKHNRSLMLCLYCLLDIMIHYENTPYSQISAVLENLGISNQNAISAIYTYIVEEPCNYLKYYLGYLEILELQKTAKELWGDDYTDYRFHRFYLECGPSDFTSLRERLDEAAAR
ncbi:MAG: DUF885 domain-containing protein [Candidatus Gastranaerophilales bacterium]|nr:DUF885 domain-containing protein [Candidatus Gastranaerophilales bacterium]